ncbi:E4 SUMO-protein ligase PIAL2-like [Corylus avellana]|uniref:E4 SUMO-protein ligase PIAL2-like n=1 Tax=Corylus avellana TaxID=13451 RepID=UPI00286D64F3|nr:E4 SUMO-protein ligase PIAL2-like [Corylus avellana]
MGGASYSSVVNSLRISSLTQRLAVLLRRGNRADDSELYYVLLFLARDIDYAVANDEVPPVAQDLPLLFKQACTIRNDPLLEAATMVLMVSVKNACKIGWFLEKETEELFTLSNEIRRSFSSPGDINTKPSNSLSAISIIMERFYPRMKMGNILASLEVKPGYGAYVIDIHILKNMPHSPKEKIWLFVAQTDNIETSACIISPPKVNFLLNGNPVDRRTNVLMETGPQFPTNVTPILKYGTNLLQAVGQFNGHYVIVVAFMSVISSSETPVLHDYVLPVVAAVDSDPDIVEGPSRISLHCPISYTRIKTPVKGHSCKHLQCFDFSNYLDINSRRPSWRCPHCNQYVCYLDICLDQNMAKVLREVGENVDEVIISADGSWKAIMGSDDHVDQAHDENAYCQKEKIEGLESSRVSTSLPNVLDLTEDNDENPSQGFGDWDSPPTYDEEPEEDDSWEEERPTEEHEKDGVFPMFGGLYPKEDGQLVEEGPTDVITNYVEDGIADYEEVEEDLLGALPNFSDEELGYVDFLGVDDILSDSHNNDCDEFYTDDDNYMFMRETMANPFLSTFMARGREKYGKFEELPSGVWALCSNHQDISKRKNVTLILGCCHVLILRNGEWNELTGHPKDRGKDSPNSRITELEYRVGISGGEAPPDDGAIGSAGVESRRLVQHGGGGDSVGRRRA